MHTCPHCGYPRGNTDERGRPAGEYDDSLDRAPARDDDGSFYCPRCEEQVTPGRV